MDRIKHSNQIFFVSMHVNPSPKFVCMPSNFVVHANKNKRRACRDERGGWRRPDWSDRVGQGWLGLPPYVLKPRALNSLTPHTHTHIYIYIYPKNTTKYLFLA
jgi:hypothetical protein